MKKIFLLVSIFYSSFIFAAKDTVYTGTIEDSYTKGTIKLKVSPVVNDTKTLPGQYLLSAELKLNKVLFFCEFENEKQSGVLGVPKYDTEEAVLSNVTLLCKPNKKSVEQLIKLTLGVQVPVKDYEDSIISLRKDKTLRGFISVTPVVDTYFVK